MADDTECDVASNGEVFDDVEPDSMTDPSHILQNVEDSCTKVLIPAMDQPSMVKNLHSLQSGGHHDVVIFPTMKGGLSSPSDDHHNISRGNLEEEEHKPAAANDALRKRLNSSPRVVKWTLEEMCTAIDSVIAGEATTTCAARKFGIPRTTLLDRLSMKSKKQYLDQPGSYPLNPENDSKIVELVKENLNLDRPTLLKYMIDMAEDLARDQGRPFENPLASRKWLKLFINKHSDLHIFPYHVRGASRSSTSTARASISSPQQHNSIPQTQHQQQPTHIIQIQPNDHGNISPVHMEMNEENSNHDAVERQPYDSFEATLAKQGAEAVERKLTAEQRSYFSYRFCNNALERGYDLWRLCKAKVDAADTENFETVLTSQALVAIEQALQEEHLKYFRFRYENPELEEGYKLWYLLKEKSLQQ